MQPGLDQITPVARPLLPRAEALLPYLRQIDETRLYSNFGPLVRSLEERLAARFKMPPGSVATTANATLGLTLTLQALGARQGSLCLMPAWSFAASAHAVVSAGLRPFFLDVEVGAGLLTPEHVLEALADMPPGEVGAVMPVAAFGHPVDMPAWDRFHEQTRIPVVVDCAAGFDGLRPSRTPAVVSLHATKVLPSGEGGFVIARDQALIAEVERRCNFGFLIGREVGVAATNAKMSEYAAAVALASLDAWAETRPRFVAVAEAYTQHLRRISGIKPQPGFGAEWVSATVVIAFSPHHPSTSEIVIALADAGIATRRWWWRGLHEEAAFAAYGREDLPVTKHLAAVTLGLPCYADMGLLEVARVCAVVADAVAAPATPDLVHGA